MNSAKTFFRLPLIVAALLTSMEVSYATTAPQADNSRQNNDLSVTVYGNHEPEEKSTHQECIVDNSTDITVEATGSGVQGSVDFHGTIYAPPCQLSVVEGCPIIQKGISHNGKTECVENYLLSFSSCELDNEGLPYANIRLSKLSEERQRVLPVSQLSPETRGMRNSQQYLSLPSALMIPKLNVEFLNGQDLSGLVYLKAKRLEEDNQFGTLQKSVTVEVNYN